MIRLISRYILNILMGIDQMFNILLGGDPDECYSSRLGKMKLRYGGKIPWYRPFPKFIAWGLEVIDPDHCIDAIEHDEGLDAIMDKYKLQEKEDDD